jgi:hypothetical protein
MGQPDQEQPNEDEHCKMQKRVLSDGTRDDVKTRSGIAAHENLAQHIGGMEWLPLGDVDYQIPDRYHRSADQSGERSLSKNRVFPTAHVELRSWVSVSFASRVQIVAAHLLKMCRRSPVSDRSPLQATIARTGTQQLFEGIDPGPMAITPLHPETVGAHQRNGQWFDVGRDSSRIEQRTPAHLLDAPGTGTGQPEKSRGKEALMADVIPLYEEAVVPAIDGVRNRKHGSWKLDPER